MGSVENTEQYSDPTGQVLLSVILFFFSVLTIDSKKKKKRMSLRFAEWDKLGCGQLYILKQMGEKWLSPIGFNGRFCKVNNKKKKKKRKNEGELVRPACSSSHK